MAITRARDKLFITSCQKRKRMNMLNECTPSRFLDEIPQNLIEYHEPKQITDADVVNRLDDLLASFNARK